MKNKNKLLIAVIALVLLMAGAVTAYNQVKDKAVKETFKEEASEEAEGKTVEAWDLDFTVYDLEGNEIKLSDMRGRPVVINFWTSWCYACTKELHVFEEAYHDYDGEVVFMMVNKFDGNRENMTSLTNFLNEKGYQFPVYLDKTKDAYTNMRVYGIPMTFFIDAEGNQIAHYSGEISRTELDRNIEKIYTSE